MLSKEQQDEIIAQRTRREEEGKRICGAHFGSRFSEASFGSIVATKSCIDSIYAWMKNPGSTLLISSNPGTGKTYMCAAVFNYLFSKFYTPRVHKERNFFEKVRGFMDLSGDYMTHMQFLIDDPFMIFDDMGSTRLNDWHKEILHSMIDYRYENKLSTMITTNLSKQELSSVFHERTISRLFCKDNFIVEFQQMDFRSNPQLLKKD